MLSTEKLLSVLHLVGGIAMFALAYQTTFWSFFVVMLAYQLAYMPTMSLTNAVVFHHVERSANATSAASACGAPSAGSRPAGRSCSSSPARPARI